MRPQRYLAHARSQIGVSGRQAGNSALCPIAWRQGRALNRTPPVSFGRKGFRFFFYSNEESPREPLPVHIKKNAVEAKFWLRPDVHIAYNDGFNAKTLNDLLVIVEQHRDQIERACNEFFSER
ncbi:MAG: hypothetical protein COZ47_12430 [Lysobacterales bacterium CG_4_10_14_3_um_filter_64_11]|nr:MAG: hypothetical protein COZ47_12430 [Xanthomonadales bacterium CG_4_10_14_3_um_filter_64_11]